MTTMFQLTAVLLMAVSLTACARFNQCMDPEPLQPVRGAYSVNQ